MTANVEFTRITLGF